MSVVELILCKQCHRGRFPNDCIIYVLWVKTVNLTQIFNIIAYIQQIHVSVGTLHVVHVHISSGR